MSVRRCVAGGALTRRALILCALTACLVSASTAVAQAPPMDAGATEPTPEPTQDDVRDSDGDAAVEPASEDPTAGDATTVAPLPDEAQAGESHAAPDGGESAEPEGAEPEADPSEADAPGPDAPEAAADTHHPPGEIEMFDLHVADTVRFRPGSGLSIVSDDRQFALTTRVRLQVRYTVEGADDAWTHELTLRRARLVFAGHFFGEDNVFKLELALSPQDTGIDDVFGSEGPELTPLLDYYLEFRQLRDLNLRIGQYKVPFSRQRVISSGDLQMVDRSIVNAQFNLDRDVGLDLRSRDLFGLGLFRYYAGVYIGQGRDAVGADDFGLMYIGRIEVLPFGLFDDYEEADFARSLRPRLSIGISGAAIDRAHGNRGILGPRPADGGTTNTQHFDADVVFMLAGFSFSSEFSLRTGQRNPGDATDELGVPIPVEAPADGWGVMAQAGYLLPDLPVEIAARYATVQPLGPDTSVREQHELGIAVSYYVARHPFKVQLDAFQLFGDEFDEGVTQFRLQLQASL